MGLDNSLGKKNTKYSGRLKGRTGKLKFFFYFIFCQKKKKKKARGRRQDEVDDNFVMVL